MPDAKRQLLESYIYSWLGKTLHREQASPPRGPTAQKQTQELDNDSNNQPRRKRERERSDEQEKGERQGRAHGRDSVLDEEGSLGSLLNDKDKRDGKSSRGCDNSGDSVGQNRKIIIAPSTMTENHSSFDVDMADDATTPRPRHNKRRRGTGFK